MKIKKNNDPWNFDVCHFNRGDSRQKKLCSYKLRKNCVTPIGNSKTKNQDAWKFHMIFS